MRLEFAGVGWMKCLWSGGCGILYWERGLFCAFVELEKSFEGMPGIKCGPWRGLVHTGGGVVGSGGGVCWGFDCGDGDSGGDGFGVKVGLHLGSVLGSLLFMKVVEIVS